MGDGQECQGCRRSRGNCECVRRYVVEIKAFGSPVFRHETDEQSEVEELKSYYRRKGRDGLELQVLKYSESERRYLLTQVEKLKTQTAADVEVDVDLPIQISHKDGDLSICIGGDLKLRLEIPAISEANARSTQRLLRVALGHAYRQGLLAGQRKVSESVLKVLSGEGVSR